ncbi:Zn-dependent protease with chaperone function [Ruminiclostridium sufflavum DSM 19573]|uniref:Zn-dependent protease with chaperone function n=1 Tax=Ruminiclostridium sufflavum DSM 19573 TaxID=1121337 RepID=A0A318Y5J6_9FIRM|nr:M48 family metallopeptidase [Ruminiclostridium sufflavum]PYG87266.1 Zn-dependent protease with chaperone function [Ruminiclostridium sufflavum DSM 19573]
MSKEIRKAVLIFFSVFVIFTCLVIISEFFNYRHIIGTYPEKPQLAVPDSVTVGMPSQDAFDFQKSKVTTWLVRLFLGFAVPAFFIFSRLSAKIRDWARRKAKRWSLIVILYFIVYSVLEMLIYLPLDMYTGFVRMHQYALSNQTFLQWLVETLKSFTVNAIVTAAVIWIPFMLIRRSPKRWWLYLALVSIPYMFFMSYIQPIVIAPMFNQYKQIEDSELSAKIDNLLSRTSIENCQVFQVDKSKETNQMNAYMTGVFNTKRIVLWDTTINYLNADEVLGVVAHEMGHYLMGHIWKSIIFGGLGSILVLYFVFRICNLFLEKTKGRYGFYRLSDVAAYPLIILIINIMLFAAVPVSNAYSRGAELEADRFELELTKNNFATATGTVKLHQQSLTMPEPGIVYMLWTYDHPTYKSRVDFANRYRPWEAGQPLKYQKYMKENDSAR